MKKDAGDVGVGAMLLVIAFVIVGAMVVIYVLQGREVRLVKNVVKSGLRISTLSCAEADTETMEKKGMASVIFSPENGSFQAIIPLNENELLLNPQESFHNFKELIEKNLRGREQYPEEESSFSRIYDIQVKAFHIYNVEGNTVTEYYMDSAGALSMNCYADGKGTVKTPGKNVVRQTSVYGSITFSYRDLFGNEHKKLEVRQYSVIRAKL